ncbi:hypothetical protein PpBr36_09023 [Pyricularia pennisetigena]|uniref:hypothetical protein n=1 Tax=Pyricularia pennisetigena TaxID=1578925 RepID=UPI00114F7B87|nr:hypothetical protein PpBr36_09023 [Pyricularia pennisetigena]TLS24436.1 hypothetical protein PpBr36_09023 [Pyricularia pennisetigena]
MSLASTPASLFIRKQTDKLLRCRFASHPRGISTASPRPAVCTPQPAVLTRRPQVASSQSGSLCRLSQSGHAYSTLKQKNQRPVDYDLRFTSQDVPFGQIWDEKREALLKSGMEADAVRLDTGTCIKEAMRFADAVAKAGNGWRPIRAKDMKFSASDLYYMGILLRTPPVVSLNVIYLGKQMLLSAGEMGHGLAIITNASLALNDFWSRGIKQLPKRHESVEFWKIMDRFTSYAQRVKEDPDVLTVSGIMAIYQGDKAKAIKHLLAAEMAGRTRAARQGDHGDPPSAGADSSSPVTSTDQRRRPRWDLECQTLLALGTLLEKSGQRDAAKAAFSTVAYELDIPEACHRLGLLLSPDDPAEAEEREALLSRAAMSGIEGAYAPLAEIEGKKAKAALAAGFLEDAAHHRDMAQQWLAMALDTVRK